MLELNESGVDVRRFYRDKAVSIVAGALPCLAYRCCRNDIDTMLNKKHAAQFPTAARVSTSPIFNNIYSVAMREASGELRPGKAYPQLGKRQSQIETQSSLLGTGSKV